MRNSARVVRQFAMLLLATVALLVAPFFSVSLVAANATSVPHVGNEPGNLRLLSASGGTVGVISIDYLAKHPGSLPIALPPAAQAALSARTTEVGTTSVGGDDQIIQPLSADGCSEDVCIDVTGDSDFVTQWGTTAYADVGGLCQNTEFRSAYGDVPGQTICGTPGGPEVFYDYTGPGGFYPDESALCNQWSSTPGLACITIEE